MNRKEAFQIDPARGIPVCLVEIDHSALVELIETLRVNVARTDELIGVIAGNEPGPELQAAEDELDEIAGVMETMLHSQVIELTDIHMEALGMISQTETWPAEPITQEQADYGAAVGALLSVIEES